MKKLIIVLVMLMLVATFAACSNDSNTFTLVSPDGAPALALAEVIEKGDFDVKVVAPSAIAAESLKSDFAILPANLAAKLYNEGNDIKLLACVTNGNLFMVSNQKEAIAVSDLIGKVVYSIGQGSVPDLLFKYILKEKGMEIAPNSEEAVEGKVAIKYFSAPSEIIQRIKADQSKGKNSLGIIAQPAVAMAEGKGLNVVMDLQKEYQQISGSDVYGYPQAVLVAKSSALDKKAVQKIIQQLIANETKVVENPDWAKEKIVGIYPQSSLGGAALTKAVVQQCNIKTYTMKENKAYYESMLEAVMKVAPPAIGGKLPDANFYYEG